MTLPAHAHVIHVSGDRRRARNTERLMGQLRAAGIANVEVFPGVRPFDNGPMHSIGEWGCFQSHLGCLRLAAAQPAGTSTLIAEDDAVMRCSPDELREFLERADEQEWDILHLGYGNLHVFRDWDTDLLSHDLVVVRGVLMGTACYVVRARSLSARVELYESTALVPPLEGGGVGSDGAFCELAWRDPTFRRLAPPRTMFGALPGATSTIRPTSVKERARGYGRHAARTVVNKVRGLRTKLG